MVKKNLITKEYYKKRPNITIRTDLSKEILRFIKKLKRLNQGSKWINEAIKEKYRREEK